jgi:hypothetical protein
MPLPETLFQRAVNKTVPRANRKEAIDELGRLDATKQLRVIAVTGGLRGTYRRQAVETLGRCDATEALEAVATDRAVESTLRERAELLR